MNPYWISVIQAILTIVIVFIVILVKRKVDNVEADVTQVKAYNENIVALVDEKVLELMSANKKAHLAEGNLIGRAELKHEQETEKPLEVKVIQNSEEDALIVKPL